jgi:hypothetical protein
VSDPARQVGKADRDALVAEGPAADPPADPAGDGCVDRGGERLAELRRAYASGTLRVSYDGKSIEYGSAADLLARIRTIEAEIASAAGRPKPRRSFAAFSKG